MSCSGHPHPARRNTVVKASVLCLLLGLVLLGCESEPAKVEAPATPVATQAAPVPTVAPAPSKPERHPDEEEVLCPQAPGVKFVDADLEREVRRKLQKPTGDVSRADLGTVRSINLSSVKVDRLDPCIFPLLTNVRDLFLGPGKLRNLKDLAALTKLQNLRASINEVEDISVLAGMTSMDRLDLAQTKVTDVSALSGMKLLTELMLDDTPVEDISALGQLSALQNLSLQRTQVKDLSPLKSLTQLKFLYVKGAQVEDTFVLAGLRKKGLQVSED